jgi:PAS domain S-box-containing protein
MSITDPQAKPPSDELTGADSANHLNGPDQPSPSGKLRQATLRFRLACLVLACVLPVCVIAGFLVHHAYQQKRQLLEQRVLETARALSMVVDQELAAMQASETALATSPFTIAGDAVAFDKEARAVLRDYPAASAITLTEASGQQLANTYVPLGTPLPKLVAWAQTKQVFETGKPVIINLYKGALTGRFVVGFAVPVFREGRVKYALMMTVPADHFQAVLSQQSIPANWPATILDGNRVVVARDQQEQGYIGVLAVPALIKATSEAAEGQVEATNRVGVPIVTVFSRSPKSGWTVGIGIPKAVILAGLRQWLWWVLGGGLLLLMMGIALAAFLAKRIGGSIQALIAPALALGSGEPVNVGPLDLAEANEVGQSLVKASQLLQQRTAERDRAEEHVAHVASFPELNPNPIFEVDGDGKVSYANPAAQKLFPDLLEHGASHPLLAEMASVIAEFTAGSKQVIIREVEADSRFFLQTNYYLPQLRRVRAYFTDITERKQAEEALRESEQQFRELAEGIPQLAWTANPEGWIYWYNQRWYQYTGTTPQQMEGWGWQSVHDPNELPKVMERWKGSITSGEPFDMVFPLRGADGIFRPFLTRVLPLRDKQGRVVRWFGTNTDISEQRRIEEALRRQADLLRISFDAIIVWRLDGGIESWNVGAEQLYGFTEREALGRVTHELLKTVHPMPWPEIEARLREFRYWEGELRHLTKDGREVVVSARKQLIRGEDGVERVLESNRDITENKRAENALREQAELLDLAHDAITVRDVDGTIRFWNHGAEGMYGFSKQQATGKISYNLLWTVFPQPPAEINADLLREGRWEGDLIHTAKDGRRIVVASRWVLQRDENGHAYGVMEINNDITNRKRAEQELQLAKRHSEDVALQLRSVVENMTERLYVCDSSGHPILVNAAFRRTYPGADAPEFPQTFAEQWEAFDMAGNPIPVADWPIGLALRGQKVQGSEFRTRSKITGKDMISSYNASPVFDSQGKVMMALFTSQDITERKRAEEALRASEERWSTTLHSIGDAVISTCARGKVTFMNEVAEKLTGWPLSEAQGRDLEEVFNIINETTRIKPESPAAKVVRLGQVVGLANHTALISRGGAELPIEDSGAPIRDNEGQITGVVLVFHDVSDKRKAEKLLRDSERLTTTGRMAATLAHEIHNPLDTVGNLLYLIDHNPDVTEAVRQQVSMASEEVTRVTRMTRHMLSFQREAKNPVPIRIGEVLDNVIALYGRKIESAAIQVEKQVDFDGEFIGLPGEMRQVFANLIGNAIEAIGKNGKIRLHAYASTDWLRGRRGLRVTVADNGPGIPAEVRNKVCDPFFTTKGEAGTGLGLWIIAGIIENNDGMLRLRTNTRDGRSGTCFSVFFPFSA